MVFGKTLRAAMLTLALAGCQTAADVTTERAITGYRPAIDLRGVDPALTVEPTKIMVLGTAHLSSYESLEPSDLDPLVDRLADFRPDVITIEHMRGEVCETLRAYPETYPGYAEGWCFDLSEFQAESGFSAMEGVSQVRSLLSDWPSAPSASQRRALAAAFLAAGEPYSALVQWWRLESSGRVAGDGLGANSVAFLGARGASMNESTQIAVRLAARLGLELVYGVEDFTSGIVLSDQGAELWDRMAEIWPDESDPIGDRQRQMSAELNAGNVLEAYRLLNSPESQRASLAMDFQRAMNDPEPEQYGRYYNSWHQVRNLRMVSAVMAAAATEPGGRVLVVVGAAHKPYFEILLDQMHDVELQSTDTVLR